MQSREVIMSGKAPSPDFLAALESRPLPASGER
jgi:hypothetical protein